MEVKRAYPCRMAGGEPFVSTRMPVLRGDDDVEVSLQAVSKRMTLSPLCTASAPPADPPQVHTLPAPESFLSHHEARGAATKERFPSTAVLLNPTQSSHSQVGLKHCSLRNRVGSPILPSSTGHDEAQ
jgi:hypothetical protein